MSALSDIIDKLEFKIRRLERQNEKLKAKVRELKAELLIRMGGKHE